MMALSKEFFEEEIKKSKLTIENLKQGIEVNELILKTFERELLKLNRNIK